ncbi:MULTISPECIES: hypothetical protein [unclassified Shinella]|uniref:hypothetical protein n=1 Tax=unclassified Shinella TaxID=2643062 RepID=UPI00225CC0EA|nr:hypothetical protein SHINE37_44658 [Rhizobiaceae bacterium]CAK7259136.1 protein of unknown function [Shinella sp. WSC3-e]
MAHTTRKTEEFLTDEENFRIDVEGNLTTEDKILVFKEDMPDFLAWVSREFQNAMAVDG